MLMGLLQQLRSQADYLQETEQVELNQLCVNSTNLLEGAGKIIQAVGGLIKPGSYLDQGG